MNEELARHHMIQQQLRTCEHMSPATVDLLYADRRENYVPAACRALAFADVALPLGGGQEMLTPKLEVRLLEEAKLGPDDTALEIGTGSGHLAALFAEQARQVWTIEIDPAIAAQARANLENDGVVNVTVETGDGLGAPPAGIAQHAPFDCIIVSGGVAEVPASLLGMLKVGGRLLAFVGSDDTVQAMHLRRIVRTAEDAYVATDILETAVPMLQGGGAARRFVF